jgi:hypothetical protein
MGTTGRSDRFPGFIEGDMAQDDIFSLIISELWLEIVRPVLHALTITIRYFN